LCPSLRISGQLLAPVVNGGGYSFWKWKDFKLSRVRDLDLDLGLGHTVSVTYCMGHKPRQMSLKSKKLFVDGRTDIWDTLYGHT